MSIASYQRVQTLTEAPRQTEQRLLREVTFEMADAWDRGARGADLMSVLHRNRQVWTTFSAACAAADNQLPPELRASFISLALWVDRYTTEVVVEGQPVGPLVEVNQAVIEGLAASTA